LFLASGSSLEEVETWRGGTTTVSIEEHDLDPSDAKGRTNGTDARAAVELLSCLLDKEKCLMKSTDPLHNKGSPRLI